MESMMQPQLEVSMKTPNSSAPLLARIPLDLSDWAGRRGLACLALEAATEVGEKAFRDFTDQQAKSRAKTLLALLTYCYAAGIYASEDIEIRAADDSMVRYLSGHATPEWAQLRAFRRQWHTVIQESLAKAFALAWFAHNSAIETDCPPSVSVTRGEFNEVPPAIDRLFQSEVGRRIQRAVLLDSMFADE